MKRSACVLLVVTAALVALPGVAVAAATPLMEIELDRLSFTATGAVKISMSYTCAEGYDPPTDEGTVLLISQPQSDGGFLGSRRIQFTDQVVCDDAEHVAIVRIHKSAGSRERFNTSDPITAIVNFVTYLPDFRGFGGEDVDTFQPHDRPQAADTLAHIEIDGVRFSSEGFVRVHMTYSCPAGFQSTKDSEASVVQQQSDGDQLRDVKTIWRRIECDGTERSAIVRFEGDLSTADPFDSSEQLHPFVDVGLVDDNGAEAFMGNGKTVLA